MSKKANKFDALAYAISKLGPPHQTDKNRTAGVSGWPVPDVHLWALPCGRRLVVYEWSDGDQSTYGGAAPARWDDPIAVRGNDDGTLCREYEEQARALIDAYAEAAPGSCFQNENN